MPGLESLVDCPSLPLVAPESDYGSDIDDDAVATLLSGAGSQPSVETVLVSIEDPVLQDAPSTVRRSVRFQRTRLDEVVEDCKTGKPMYGLKREATIEIEYDERNGVAFSPTRLADPQATAAKEGEDVAPEQPGDDPRSPLARFRRTPKKPLSVTDFVSPAWCEQQYWYSLSRYGRVKQTPAMRKGSSVHKVLEEQVHRELRVEVKTREDAFGLRIWNVIQGLRTLRATGMTRELELWGFVEDELVNGIVDEVGTTCPDEELEEKMLIAGKTKTKPLEANQQTLSSFLTSSQNGATPGGDSSWLGTLHPPPKTFYITDVKTRQSTALPGTGSPSKPVHIQLMLYHRLLTSLSRNEIPAADVFARYRLNSEAMFSDSFIAEISQLDFNMPDNVSSADEGEPLFESSQDSMSELLAHNSLTSLWGSMIQEFARTIPHPSTNSQPSPISPLMAAEYRLRSTGALIGKRSFKYESDVIEPYLEDAMHWWRGERPTRGVEIEDAFKCRMCDFAEGCSWRKGRVDKGIERTRLRRESLAKAGRKKSEV
ncbi:hypothetical protein B0A48_05591 [Cryoendolithus antarcticus]|uniref:Exonuclease V, mitochondrial n=1 Tax=Cryoendolithus antarcticus TaxID=1507870 RepID=A0A1V8TIW5_9PEZI|nr:hypothetical protein B0A48_05591 [Cryoendolithus antarcticus]